MPASLIDSPIFGNLFGTQAMREVWSDENRTRKYLDIEAALARVQARLGIIPQNAAEEIVRNCRLEKIDMAKLAARTQAVGYPVLPLVSQIVANCADDLGQWCHWGATTQDITDTATVRAGEDTLCYLIGADVADARANAYEGVAMISFPGAQWRRDIAAGR